MAFECVVVKEELNFEEENQEIDNEVTGTATAEKGSGFVRIKTEIDVPITNITVKAEPIDPPSSPEQSKTKTWHVPVTEEITHLPNNYVECIIKEEEPSEDVVVAKKRKKKEILNWNLVHKFDNHDQAEVAVKIEGTWSLHYYHTTEGGKKNYYRCNKLKKRGPQCSAKMYLFIDNTSEAVLMYKADADHDHDEKAEHSSSLGLTAAVKAEVNKLIDLKMKPKAIMQRLCKMKHIKPPKMTQLTNYMHDRRRGRAGSGEPIISLTELEDWILSHTKVPEERHEVFVISYKIEESDETKLRFRFVISTKHLIEIANNASVVHIDDTNKIIWQDCFVYVCGTTDQNRKFHPLCLAVTSTERKEDFKMIFEGLRKIIQECHKNTWCPKVLVCDGTRSIENAFLEIFGDDALVRICWAYAKKKIQARVDKVKNKKLLNDILLDVDALHSITAPQIFDAASEAFLQKYKSQTTFVKYFREQWLIHNRNWYLGAAANSPPTNDALESFIKVLKDNDTIRKRSPLSRFLEESTKMVQQWSTNYTSNPEEYYIAKFPSISLENWADSYEWANLNKEVTELRSDENYTYYKIPAGQAEKSEIFKKPWESFDDFKIQNFSKWLVSLPNEKEDWRHGKCNCPVFFKMYVCKHVIGLGIRLKYVEPPSEVIKKPMKRKRKGSHPAKAKNTLII